MPRFRQSTLDQTANSFPVVPITVEEFVRIFGWGCTIDGARRRLAELHRQGALKRSWQTHGGSRRLVYYPIS
jgi:hypothetical protein